MVLPKINVREAIILAFVVLAPVFLLLYFWQLPLLQELTYEDGPVEYLTAAVFLLAAVGLAAAGFWRSARKLWVLPLAVASFVVAGEEISWGQRLLGLSTPAALEGANVQSEITLHNIEGIHGNIRMVGVLGLLALFALFPLLVRYSRVVRQATHKLRLPWPPLTALPLVLIGIAFMAGPRVLAGREYFEFDEVGELYVAVAWLVFALSVWANSGPDSQEDQRTAASPGTRRPATTSSIAGPNRS